MRYSGETGLKLTVKIINISDGHKAHGILADFFEKLLPEEVNMLVAEWKLKEALAVEREEGFENGREERNPGFVKKRNYEIT
jgi:hypothetical protein